MVSRGRIGQRRLDHPIPAAQYPGANPGPRRHEVRVFIEMLEARGLIAEREAVAPDSLFGSLRPLGGWLRRALAAAHIDR